uniref:Corticotropin-releasing factor receptor 1 n=1 Tax=Pipistrellus kuhlii TaxID=59472 RepID=A0A7J7U7X9_PIPKU|nr:corticotropin releasing hormone receptor 1 [Pipistrellus kuhlii]
MGRRPRLRLLKALLLLGLNPVSAFLQDQHCESLSPASNVSGLQCNASVDLIGTCWPQSPAGQLVVRPCPAYFYGVRYNTTNNGYRQCLANGSWAARVNYSECQEILSEEKKNKVHYHLAIIINYLGHCISLVALLVAFVLFLRLRSIRCLRNIIHWNLISAFILRNATWFVVQLTMSPEVHQSNVGWCRLVTAAYNYFHVTNFFWMFGEGCYLHTAIVLTYSTDRLRKWMFILIGWGVPFPIIVAWAVGKLYYDNEKCWFGKRPGVYTDYIYQGPMILVLLEGCEGHSGTAPPAGHHLHAVLREPRGGRGLPGRLHLLQLLPGVLPGLLRVCVLLFPQQRGPLCRPEEVAPMAGQALDPRPGGPRHVHPHLPNPGQLPQHQAVHGGLSWRAVSAADQPAPSPPHPGTETREAPP